MAVLIDIDMPEECGKCCFLNAKCFLKGRNPFSDTMDISRGRPYWCPLREVVECKDCAHEGECPQGFEWEDEYVDIYWCQAGERREE